MTRDDAYRVVQRAAMRSWDDDVDFRAVLAADPAVDPAVLDDAFDLDRSLRHLDHVFHRLDALDA
jgi:adenylosuccinate lyase